MMEFWIEVAKTEADKVEFDLFYTEDKRKWARSNVDFVERNSRDLLLSKGFPGGNGGQ